MMKKMVNQLYFILSASFEEGTGLFWNRVSDVIGTGGPKILSHQRRGIIGRPHEGAGSVAPRSIFPNEWN